MDLTSLLLGVIIALLTACGFLMNKNKKLGGKVFDVNLKSFIKEKKSETSSGSLVDAIREFNKNLDDKR